MACSEASCLFPPQGARSPAPFQRPSAEGSPSLRHSLGQCQRTPANLTQAPDRHMQFNPATEVPSPQTQSPGKPQLVARGSAHCKQASTAQSQKPQPSEGLTPAPSTVADTVLLDQKIETGDNLHFQTPDAD